MIMPSMTYGAHIWALSKINEGTKEKMKRLNRLALKCIAPMRDKTPTAGLEIIANMPPIEITAIKEGMLTYNRIKGTYKPTWDGLGKKKQKGHMRQWKDFLATEKLILKQEDKMATKSFHWEPLIPEDIPLNPQEQNIWEENQSNGATCFMAVFSFYFPLPRVTNM